MAPPDQLTLSQPRVADYAHQITLAPLDFQTFRRPCYIRNKAIKTAFPWVVMHVSHYVLGKMIDGRQNIIIYVQPSPLA